MKNISEQVVKPKEELAYIVGYLDGEGRILAQIVTRESYRYQYQVFVSIQFSQKTKRH